MMTPQEAARELCASLMTRIHIEGLCHRCEAIASLLTRYTASQDAEISRLKAELEAEKARSSEFHGAMVSALHQRNAAEGEKQTAQSQKWGAESRAESSEQREKGLREIIKDLLGDSYITEEGSSLCFFCQAGKEGQTDDDDLMSLLENPDNHAEGCTWKSAVEVLRAQPAAPEGEKSE